MYIVSRYILHATALKMNFTLIYFDLYINLHFRNFMLSHKTRKIVKVSKFIQVFNIPEMPEKHSFVIKLGIPQGKNCFYTLCSHKMLL